MVNGLNQSANHNSFSMDRSSKIGGQAAATSFGDDQLSQNLADASPIIASKSVERQRIRNLALSNAQKPFTSTERSFSIQPQYKMMHKRLDELSQGSSQERLNNIYRTLQDTNTDGGGSASGIPQGRRESAHDARNFRITASRESSNHTNVSRALKSRQRGGEQPEFKTRNLRSPVKQKRGQTIGEGGGSAEPPTGMLRVPGILMDSINSQQLRSKSTFRANGAVGYGANKFTSLQTMAYTSDQQYSSGAGAITGMNSMQSYNGARDKVNMDRCALLEEIEKSKIEEIKLKTLKNIDKYSKNQAIFNVTNLNKFANAPTAKYVPMMNSTLGSQGVGSSRANNPFSGAASKAGNRSNVKSRGATATVMDSQVSSISKNSFEKSPTKGHLIEKLNEQLRERNISPQKGRGLNFMLTKSPILVQKQLDEMQSSGGAAALMTSPTPLLGAREDNMPTQISDQLGETAGGTSRIAERKFSRNTINLAKLSFALKNKSNLESKTVANGGSYSQMADNMVRRFHQDEINSIASILNETLSKLKKPNTHFLQPLAVQKPTQTSQQVSAEGGKAGDVGRRNSRLNLLNIVGGIRQSVQSREPDSASKVLVKQDSISHSIQVAEDANSIGAEDKGTIAEEEVDLDDLTQEDKFYLIQQIEAVQKNIRYSAKQATYIFQDFDESTGLPLNSATTKNSRQPDQLQSRYGSESTPGQESFTEVAGTDQLPQTASTIMSGRDSPKVQKKGKQFGGRNLQIVVGKKTAVSPTARETTQQQVSRNNINNSNAVSFVTSALGLLAQESLEIIEDADEVEEDELDTINIGVDRWSPRLALPEATKDDFSPLHAQKSDEPPSPGQGPFRHHSRKLRRNLNEGHQQILSKGELKRYKQDDEGEEQLGEVSEENDDGPEEVSVLLHRGSRIAKDFDVLRFSKASSMDQNFLLDTDNDSRLGVYANIGSAMKTRDGGGLDHSSERATMVEHRSPMAIKRRKSSMFGGMGAGGPKNSTLRKLTNSLFEDSAFGEKHNVIKEEEKERDEQD